MDKETEQKVIDYVVKNYRLMFEKVTPIVNENETVFMVLAHKDGSPLILSKEILNK
jgi:hypothetical protein|tara:strand:+ start:2834 stop:3001 length:168 start_codon:yes stop_codon:yes gene_type:complete